jgi:hypothetical protein
MSKPNLWHDPWIPHATSTQPVSDDTIVRIRWVSGEESKYGYPAFKLKWARRGWMHDITHYRIVKEAE